MRFTIKEAKDALTCCQIFTTFFNVFPTNCGHEICFNFSGVPYNIFKADIWSLGVILFAMLTGRFPFADLKELVKMKDGVSFIGSRQDVSYDAVQLIRRMLQIDPNSRISIDEVCRHKWVNESG